MSELNDALKKYLDITSAVWEDYAKLGKALLGYLLSEQERIPYGEDFEEALRELFLFQINQLYPSELEFAEIVFGLANVSAYHLIEDPYSHITCIDPSDIEDGDFSFYYGKRFADVCSRYAKGYGSGTVDEVYRMLFKDAPDHIFSRELPPLPPGHRKKLRRIDEEKTAELLKRLFKEAGLTARQI